MLKVDDGIIRQCIKCGKVCLHDVHEDPDYYEIAFTCWRCWRTYCVVDVIKAGLE